MLGLAIAALVIGVIMLFVLPWVGVPVALVGLILLVVYFVGAGRRTTAPRA